MISDQIDIHGVADDRVAVGRVRAARGVDLHDFPSRSPAGGAVYFLSDFVDCHRGRTRCVLPRGVEKAARQGHGRGRAHGVVRPHEKPARFPLSDGDCAGSYSEIQKEVPAVLC